MSLIRRSLALLTLSVLAAPGCQPGGETSGIDGTGVRAPVAAAAYGRVTGFGSIVVNGVHYDTTDMRVIVDGTPATLADIAAGDIVFVSGTRTSTSSATGVATLAEISHAVVGPIDALDIPNASVVAFGQTVRLADAVFDESIPSASINGLAVGDFVSISGFRTRTNELVATRISMRSPTNPEFKVVGTISNVDATDETFDINALRVDHSRGSAPGLIAGMVVEVRGRVIGPSHEALAELVLLRPTDVTASPGDYVELEGYLTAFDSANPLNFQVAGLPITTTDSTLITGLISENTKIEVAGTLGVNGTLIANRLEAGPPFTRGTHTLQGVVYDAYTGPVPNVTVDIDLVFPDGSGASWWWVIGAPVVTDSKGHFAVTGLPDSQVELLAGGFRRGYLQPCVTTVDVRGDVTRDVEVVTAETLNSLDPPRPLTAREPTLTGLVFEMTPGGRQPLAGAYVEADHNYDIRALTLTDLNGRYFLCGLPTKNVELAVGKDGYIGRYIEPVDTSQSGTLDLELTKE